MLDTLLIEKIELNDPKDAEEFAKLDFMQKFMLRMKWCQDEIYGGCNILDKLKIYDKPLEKEVIKVDFIEKNYYKYYDTKLELMNDLNINSDVFRYLKQFKNKNIKNPKYIEYYKYKLSFTNLKLSGNNYIENNTK